MEQDRDAKVTEQKTDRSDSPLCLLPSAFPRSGRTRHTKTRGTLPGIVLPGRMAAGDSFRTAAGETLSPGQAFRYLWRAARLQCPVCGTKPIFVPLRRVRNFHDWFTPLDGCPRCGYPYEREPGYFLLAIFGFNFGFAVFLGMASFIALALFDDVVRMPWWQLMALTGLPIPIVNVLIARHAKALFIALDHFVDPHVRENDHWDDDDDDGIHLLPPATGGSGDGSEWPADEDEKGEHSDAELVGAGSRR